MKLEILHVVPEQRRHALPVLFVHGSFCAAWVWREHFLPYFSAQGFEAYALSLRGHGGSEGDLWSASLEDYVEDLDRAIERIAAVPLLVGHSLGGMVVQKYLERKPLPGAVLLASLPPHGLMSLGVGMMLRDPLLLQQVFMAEANLVKSLDFQVLRQALFSTDLQEDKAHNYLRRMGAESVRVLADLLQVRVVEPERVRRHAPVHVIGAQNDALVSTQMTDLTARTYHTQAQILPDLAHAMMLDSRWQEAADAVRVRLEQMQPEVRSA